MTEERRRNDESEPTGMTKRYTTGMAKRKQRHGEEQAARMMRVQTVIFEVSYRRSIYLGLGFRPKIQPE